MGTPIVVETTNGALYTLNDSGQVVGTPTLKSSASVAQQTGFSADTYLTNSGILLPAGSMVAGMVWEWRIVLTKTAAGTAAPVWQVRIGATRSTSDTSRLSITTASQTAAADTALVTVLVTCRSVGASGVLRGAVHLQHNLAATGFANTPAGFNVVQGTSAGFDNSALGGSYVGLSVNGGASAAWTVEQVIGRLVA